MTIVWHKQRHSAGDGSISSCFPCSVPFPFPLPLPPSPPPSPPPPPFLPPSLPLDLPLALALTLPLVSLQAEHVPSSTESTVRRCTAASNTLARCRRDLRVRSSHSRPRPLLFASSTSLSWYRCDAWSSAAAAALFSSLSHGKPPESAPTVCSVARMRGSSRSASEGPPSRVLIDLAWMQRYCRVAGDQNGR